MTQVALLAEFEAKEQDLDLFLAAAQREVSAVRANEPACLTFEVIFAASLSRYSKIRQPQRRIAIPLTSPHFLTKSQGWTCVGLLVAAWFWGTSR